MLSDAPTPTRQGRSKDEVMLRDQTATVRPSEFPRPDPMASSDYSGMPSALQEGTSTRTARLNAGEGNFTRSPSPRPGSVARRRGGGSGRRMMASYFAPPPHHPAVPITTLPRAAAKVDMSWSELDARPSPREVRTGAGSCYRQHRNAALRKGQPVIFDVHDDFRSRAEVA